MSTPIRTVIVDDEALSRRGIELRLLAEKDFEVVAQCANGSEAVAAIRSHRPDLLFLDIQMPGMTGFDVLATVSCEIPPAVVFITAYDHYAIRAFEAHALDYLLKPVEEARFAAMIGRVREHIRARTAVSQRDRLLSLIGELTGDSQLDPEELLARGPGVVQARYPEALPIRQGREILRVPVESIDWVDAAGDYMCIHAQGRTHILRGTMKDLEQILDPRLFQRVHRSTIVNLCRVCSLRAHMNGEYFLILAGGQELKLSRTYRDKVEYFLKGGPEGRCRARTTAQAPDGA